MVVSTLKRTTLTIEFDAGVVDGKQIVKNKTFNKIKKNATPANLHELALIYISLQDLTMLNVLRNDVSAIINE